MVSLNLVTVPTVRILINFVTQLTNLHEKRTVWETLAFVKFATFLVVCISGKKWSVVYSGTKK